MRLIVTMPQLFYKVEFRQGENKVNRLILTFNSIFFNPLIYI